jgi:hypothetical protein
MKLNELAVSPAKQIAQVFESYFGQKIKFEQLSFKQTNVLLNRVRNLLSEHRSTTARHYSEQDPRYLKLVMMEQALETKLKEQAPSIGAKPNPAATGAANTNTAQQAIQTIKDPKLKTALDKSQKGLTLTPEEQKMVAGAALMHQESRLKRAFSMLKESEVQQAQVVLAAQDMVDNLQAMIEDSSEMQFKELPALVDSIRNQVGPDQATQFNTDASSALATLVQSLQGAKQQLESALGVVTGQPTGTVPGVDDLTLGPPEDIPVDDTDIETDIETDVEPDSGALGRARRK